MPVRRFYLELVRYRRQAGPTLPVEALLRPGMRAALHALGQAGAAAGVEVRVAALVELGSSLERATAGIVAAGKAMWDSGVHLDVWPQVPDDETRWLNTSTVGAVHEALSRLLDGVERRGRPPDLGLCLDVEPPLALLRAAQAAAGSKGLREGVRAARWLTSTLTGNLWRAREGRRGFTSLARELTKRALPVHVAVLPPFFTARVGEPFRHWLLGVPLLDEDGAALLGRAAPMCYASMLRPLARGRRDVERALLRRSAAQHARHFAGRQDEPLAIALGLLSHGVLGEEPVYEELSHLEQDLDDVRALGFEDVAFFSLEGLLYGPAGTPSDESFTASRTGWRSWASRLVR